MSNNEKVSNSLPSVAPTTNVSPNKLIIEKKVSESSVKVSEPEKVSENVSESEKVLKHRKRKEVIEEKAIEIKGESVIKKPVGRPKIEKIDVKPTKLENSHSTAFKLGIIIGILATMTATYFLYMKIKEQRKKKFLPGDIHEGHNDLSTLDNVAP